MQRTVRRIALALLLILVGCGAPEVAPVGEVGPNGSESLILRVQEPLDGMSLAVELVGERTATLAGDYPVPDTGQLRLELEPDVYALSVQVKDASGQVLGLVQEEVDFSQAARDEVVIPAFAPEPEVVPGPEPTPEPIQSRASLPNVVLIVLDDVDYFDLGCYGSTVNDTPRLDRLAAEGMRFTSHYSSGPLCSPTRAALLTSRAPAAYGLTSVIKPYPRSDGSMARPARGLPSASVYVAQLFQELGYATAMIGKWHLGNARREYLPTEKGFQTRMDIGTGAGYWGYGIFSKGWVKMPAQGEPEADDHYLTKELTDRAINYLDQHQAEPFFVYLAYFSIHEPLHVPPRFDNTDLQYDLTTDEGKTSAMLYDLDREIGRVVDHIDALGLGDDTLVVVVSDNGGVSFPRPSLHRRETMRGFKAEVYEGGIRVPMIARWPGNVPAGSTNDSVCSSIDLMPTFASLIGSRRPGAMQGRDLSPSLLQNQVTSAPPLFWVAPRFKNWAEFLASGKDYDNRDQFAVRSGNLKLAYGRDGQFGLYDVSAPEGEFTDVSADYPGMVDSLLGSYKAWHSNVGRIRYEAAREPTSGGLLVPFDSRFDFVEADFTFSIDARATSLEQRTVLACRPGCWELAWFDDRVRLTLYDDRPGTLQERAVHLSSRPLTPNETHRISFTVYAGQGWESNRVLSLYVDGRLHRRLMPDDYPAGTAFWAAPSNDEPIYLGADQERKRRFRGTVWLPRLHALALSVDEL